MKKVVNCWYVHKSNISEILEKLTDPELSDVIQAIKEINLNQFKYEVIKYDKAKHRISFIDSPDWITANEPKVCDAWMLDMKYKWTWKFVPARKKNPQIYHSKELFVSDDYKGFDIERAKERTRLWKSIPNLDTKRIGNKDFWLKFLAENGMEE